MASFCFLFVDLDALLVSVHAQVPTLRDSGLALDAMKLSTLLEDSDSVVRCRRGSYRQEFSREAAEFEAIR